MPHIVDGEARRHHDRAAARIADVPRAEDVHLEEDRNIDLESETE
ncbi:hypothetical protein [Halorubrum sp. CBA1229]|nr:hypothetical protein [Halorubrum sp. CBA1229]